jgi:hypothetical protein
LRCGRGRIFPDSDRKAGIGVNDAAILNVAAVFKVVRLIVAAKDGVEPYADVMTYPDVTDNFGARREERFR